MAAGWAVSGADFAAHISTLKNYFSSCNAVIIILGISFIPTVDYNSYKYIFVNNLLMTLVDAG